MRILLVTEDIPVPTPGGAGKHAVLLGNSLIAAGHEVELLGRVRAPGVEGNSDFAGPLHCNISLRGTGWQEHRFGAFLPGRRNHIGRRIWSAVRALGVERFDVIHYHGHHSAVGACVPASVNFVQTLHDQGSECITMTRFKNGQPCDAIDPRACASCATSRPNRLQTAISAAAVRRLRATSVKAFSKHETIFVSNFLERRFREHVQPTAALKSQVVHNFTDAAAMRQALAAATPPARATQRPVALVVGRIDRTKGMAALLAALSQALVERFQWRIVGDGPARRELEAEHKHKGIEFVGFLPQQRVYAETAAATVCVVPSLWEEAFGTTTLEALALGRPVFALRRGATPELARYGRYAGQLALSESIEELVAAIGAASVESAPRPTGVDDMADVLRRIPAIVDVYRRAAGSLRGSPEDVSAVSSSKP